MKSTLTLGILLTGKDQLSPVLSKTEKKLGSLNKRMGDTKGATRFKRALGSMAEKTKQYTKSVIGSVNKMSNVSTKSIGLMTASFVAMSASMSLVNRETAQMSNLADTVGLSYGLVSGLGGAIKAIGLDYEHVTDMMEELNNKIGESKVKYAEWLKEDKAKGKELKLVGGVDDAFKGLNFSLADKSFKGLNYEETFKKFTELKGDKQFEIVIGTALKMKDEQKAASMVDILMGGEANKILSFLRKQNMTLNEFLAKREELNFLDKKGLEGALKYNKALGNSSTILGSIMKQISGIGGGFLTPYLENMNKWLILNKEVIQENIVGFFDGVGMALGNVSTALEVLHSYAKPVFRLFGSSKTDIEDISNSGMRLGSSLVYIISGLIALKVATSIIGRGLKIASFAMGLFGSKSKKSSSLIRETVDAVGELSRSTRKPLSLKMGIKMPAKKTILGRMGSLIGTLSRFALANPVVLGVAVSGAAFYGAYALYKKTLEKDVMGISEKRISIAKREENANVPLALRVISPAEQKAEEKRIKERRNIGKGLSKNWTLKDQIETKRINKTLTIEEIERKLSTKEEIKSTNVQNSLSNSLKTNKIQETHINVEAPINITVNGAKEKVDEKKIAQMVKKSIHAAVKQKNNEKSFEDED